METVKRLSCRQKGKTSSGGKIKKESDEGIRNQAKRHLSAGSTPALLDVSDFKILQQKTYTVTHTDASKSTTVFTPTTRTSLQHRATSHVSVSEGDLVSMSGFLHRAAEGSAKET